MVLDLQQRLSDAMPGKVLKRAILNATLLARAGLLEWLAMPATPTLKPFDPCCVEHRPDGGVRLEYPSPQTRMNHLQTKKITGLRLPAGGESLAVASAEFAISHAGLH